MGVAKSNRHLKVSKEAKTKGGNRRDEEAMARAPPEGGASVEARAPRWMHAARGRPMKDDSEDSGGRVDDGGKGMTP